MLQRGIIFCIAVCGLGLTATAADTPATKSLTVTEIVEKNVAARGGLAAWRAVHTMLIEGDMDAGHGVKLPYTLELKRPRKMRLELQYQGKTAVEVYDGSHGWKTRPFLNRTDWEPMSPFEAKVASGQTDLDGMLIDYAAKGIQLELMGSEAVEGHDAFKLKVTMPGGMVRHLWVDAMSLLEVKVDSVRRMDGKERLMETYLRDYRLDSGLLIPHVLETATEGIKQTQKLTVKNVVLNPQLMDTRFLKP